MPSNEAPQTFMEKMEGARKLIVGAVILITGVAIALFKNDIPPNLLQLLQVIFGGFIVGNVGEHIVGAVHAKADASVDVAKIQADASQPEPWDDEFSTVLSAQEALHQDVRALQANVQALTQLPDGDEKIEASIAALTAKLEQAMTAPAPTGEQIDYASIVQSIVQKLDTLHAAQAENLNTARMVQKALSIMISRGSDGP